MKVYVVSVVAGLGVGVLYGLTGVRSPAPPIIALLGLLGMLTGEALVSYLRGHPETLSQLFHTKSFAAPQPPRSRPPTLRTAQQDPTGAPAQGGPTA